eukprot:2692474-Prymnesium_polylepis.1
MWPKSADGGPDPCMQGVGLRREVPRAQGRVPAGRDGYARARARHSVGLAGDERARAERRRRRRRGGRRAWAHGARDLCDLHRAAARAAARRPAHRAASPDAPRRGSGGCPSGQVRRTTVAAAAAPRGEEPRPPCEQPRPRCEPAIRREVHRVCHHTRSAH